MSRFVICIVSLAIISCAATSAREQATVGSVQRDEVVSGWGGFALSATTTSLWLTQAASGHGRRSQPVIMIYFVGSPGWHDETWTFDGNLSQLPAYVRLSSEHFELSTEYQGDGRAIVQGTPVRLSSANVFLVAPIDGEWSVKPLAKIVFDVPSAGIPAVHVLSSHPEVRRAVVAASERAA